MKIKFFDGDSQKMYYTYLHPIYQIDFEKDYNSINDLYLNMKFIYAGKSVDADNKKSIFTIDIRGGTPNFKVKNSELAKGKEIIFSKINVFECSNYIMIELEHSELLDRYLNPPYCLINLK